MAKVCPKKKEKAALQAIRFFPRYQDNLPYVYATDGLRASLIKIDLDDLPNVLLPAGDLVKAAKDPGGLDVVESGSGKIELRTDISTYELLGMPLDHYPGIPAGPGEYRPIKTWPWVKKVFHAAGRETVEPELAVINFTPEYVEATDKSRVVRIELQEDWRGLVPASTFKAWPKGDVWSAFTSAHAFFWVGEELRIGTLFHNANYPKTAGLLPKEHKGPYIVVPTGALGGAVRQGSVLSHLGLVTFEITLEKLIIRAWQEGRELSEGGSYVATIDVLGGSMAGSMGAGMLLLTGKYLDEALRPVASPNVKLGFGGIADPLRIESGVYTACIWQMLYS